MDRKSKRRILIVTTGLVSVAVLALLFQPTVVEVETHTIDRGTLQVTVEEQGRTRARYRYTVAAPVAGRLLRTGFDEGDRVESGTELTKIAPPPEDSRNTSALRAQLSEAEAHREEAKARLAEAKSNLALERANAQRRNDLFARGLVSSEERDQFLRAEDTAKARVESAAASLSAAEASVASARARLIGIDSPSSPTEFTSVLAPVSGTILRVFEESERVVAAGAPLFELGKGSDLEIIIDFLTQDAVKVQAGDEIRISGWGGSEELIGTVRYVEPGAFTKISTLGVEEQRVNVIGDFIDPPPSLGAGFRVEAAIVVWEAEDVLRVQTTAIFRRDGEWHTFVIRDGKAQLQRINVGQRGVDFAEVVDGVAENDVVILFPSDLIEDGVRVSSD